MNYLSISLKQDRVLVPCAQIIYFLADSSYTWIYLKGGKKYLSSKNLGKFEHVLILDSKSTQNQFFRIHHGIIVNTRYIRKFNNRESRIELICGKEFNIAQRKKGDFRKAMETFSQFI